MTDLQLKEVTRHIKSLADEKPLALSDVDAVLNRWVDGYSETQAEAEIAAESVS